VNAPVPTALVHNFEQRLRPFARPLAHVAFWLVALGFYTVYFARETGNYMQSLLFVCLLLPVAMGTTYFTIYVLIPRYLFERRYGRFLLYLTYTLIASIYLELVLVWVVFILIAGLDLSAVNAEMRDVVNLGVGLYLVVFLAAAINLFQRWYRMQAANAALTRAKLEAELKLKEAELQLLRAQIHPHFLFNTLNNLYGLTLERSDRAPEVVLSIADMLDYMLYRCNAPRVALDDELQYLRNYLALEGLRYDDRVTVSFDIEGETAGLEIAPMLLIPFVENAFKHGVSQDAGRAWVKIILEIEGQLLRFSVANSRPENASPGFTEGLGLQNARRRLDLLYPDQYELNLAAQVEEFRAALTLNLEKPT
jgi:sensor histidine kinase YesM